MITAQILIFTFLVPFLISFIIDMIFINKGFLNKATIIGLIFSCLSGYIYLQGIPSLPPENLNQSFFYQFIILGIVCLIIQSVKNTFIQLTVKITGLLFISYISFKPLIEGIGLSKAIIYTLLITFLGIAYDLLFNKIQDQLYEKKFIILPYLFYLSLVSSIIIFMYSSAFLSQIAGILSFIILSKIILKLIKKDYFFQDTTFYFYSTIISVLCFLSNYLLEIPNHIVMTLVLSPFVLLVNFNDNVKKLSKQKFVILNFILISIPLLFVLIKTTVKYLSEEPYYG